MVLGDFMATKVKIRINDNKELRIKIDELYEKTNDVDLAKQSLLIAKHILDIVSIDYHFIDEIVNGFDINELWQIGEASIYDIRQAGFKIHKIARETDSEIKRTAFRVVGQAVGTGHMKEHAMMASDYAIKVINLIYPNDFDAVTKERNWQINELKKLLK